MYKRQEPMRLLAFIQQVCIGFLGTRCCYLEHVPGTLFLVLNKENKASFSVVYQ